MTVSRVWRRKVWKWMATLGVAAGSLLPFRQVWADEPDDKPPYAVEHAECVLFGPRRARFQQGGAAEAARRQAAFTQMTNEVTQVLGPAAPSRSRSGALRPSTSPGPIDEILFAGMRANGITPADPATDQEFLRRVTLDLTGRIPTAGETSAFLADASPGKRTALVDRLLDSPQWVDKWVMFFGDLYANSARNTQVVRYAEGRDAFYRYLKGSLQQNKPYDQMARELISATGTNSYQQGELDFLVGGFTSGGPVQDTYDTQAAQISEMFLGVAHVNCILCHNGARHLDSLSLWGKQATRQQAWGMASFVSRTQLQRRPVGANNQPYYWSVLDTGIRDYTLNTTTGNRPARQAPSGQPNTVAPAYLFGGGRPNPGEPYRQALARLVTGDFQFARAAVNHIWRQFFLIGMVEPPDQFDPLRLDPNGPPPEPWTLQPSSPQLLDRLARDFVAGRYDLKALIRQIVNSQVYQLSSRYNGNWNASWDKFYARKLVRRLDAEEMHDALVQSGGIPVSYNIGGLGTVEWAMQLPEPVNMPPRGPIGFLDSFLRGDRDEEDRSNETSVVQALNLMNDPFVLARLAPTPSTSLIGRTLNLPDDQLTQALFLNALSRYPTEAESAAGMNQLRNGAGSRTQRAQGLLWSLYNKVDFIFNY